MARLSLRSFGALFALLSLTACGANEPVHVATVTVTPATSTKIVGESVQLAASTLDAKGAVLAGRVVTWSSSNTSTASVSSAGLVTAVAAGSVTITATSEGQNGTSAITVLPPPVTSVTVTPATQSITETQTTQLTAVTRIGNGVTVTGRTVAWSSSAIAVATVDNTGLVTGVAPGAATITATSEGISGTAAITVTISPCNTSLALPLAAGQTVNGTLAATDCPFGDGTFLDVYRMTLATSTTVDVLLKSSAFDAYLFIYGPNATGTGLVKVGEDDDSGGGSDARLSGFLAAGTYYVLANSININGLGAYTLSLVSPFVAGSRNLNSVQLQRVETAGSRDVPGIALRGLVRHR